MPIRGNDGGHLADLGRDERQPVFREAKNVDLNVQSIVRGEFSNDSARDDIEILKALEDTRERAWISVSDDAKPE